MTNRYRMYVLCPTKRYNRVVSNYLAEALGAYRITPRFYPHYFPQRGSVLVNYGVGETPVWWDDLDEVRILNTPQAVCLSADKAATLRALERAGVPHVPFTTSSHEAQQWANAGNLVYCRTLTRASNGRGIVLAGEGSGRERVARAPLYTQKVLRNKEHRIHIVAGRAVAVVQKKRRTTEGMQQEGLDMPDDFTRLAIRSWYNGWVFAHHNIVNCPELEQTAIDAAAAVGLDWGAIDIVSYWNRRGRMTGCWVVETNSAAGITDARTMQAYTGAMTQLQ